MEANKIERVDHWRKKAFDLSSSDRLGFVLSRAMDLMAIVVKDGTAAKNLQFAARSLEMERNLTMEEDAEKDAPLREMVYGLCETLGITIKSILDERSQEQLLPPAPEMQELPTAPEMLSHGEIKEESLNEAILPRDVPSAVGIPESDHLEMLDASQSSLVFPKEEDTVEMEEAEDEESVNQEEMVGQLFVNHHQPVASSSLVTLAHRFLNNATPSISPGLQRPVWPPKKKKQTEDRSHDCDVCQKKFTSKKSMENHKLVHSGVRNHICSLCGWEFMRRSDLLRHLKNVDHSRTVKISERREFECETCGVAFYRLADKSNHVRTMHMDGPVQ